MMLLVPDSADSFHIWSLVSSMQIRLKLARFKVS